MPGASESVGRRFRAAREARGLTLSDVAEQIRIRSVYLAAIEDEHWSTIGAPVYIRGFLRTYARFLGIDPEEAVAAFHRVQPPPPPPGSGSSEPEIVERAPARGTLLVGIAAVVAVLLIAFVVYSELTVRSPETTGNAGPTAALPASASPVATPAIGTPVAQAARRPAAPAVADGARSLALVLSAPSWLRVTVDGSVSMEGTFPAGTTKTFHGRSALVRIGNAGGVEVFVDGKDLGKLGKSGDVVEQAFTL